MLSRKQIKSAFFVVAVVISIFGVLLSNDNSKLSFLSSSSRPTPTFTQNQQIEGAFVSIVPSSTEDSSVDSTIEQNDDSPSAPEGASGYQVVKVVDGDTIDVNIDGKVERLRLIGIDTPETVDPRKPVQCFGKAASDKAKEILTNQFVTLEADESQGDRDKYQRLLRYVFLPDGTNYGLFMISEGYAHEYTYHLPYKYQVDFKQAEVDARNSNKGLWSPDTCSGNK